MEAPTNDGGSQKRLKAQQQAEPVVGLLGESKEEDAGDGETKPKQMTKDQPASKKEREVKDFLAAEQSSDNCMAGIAVSMAKDPEARFWARELVVKYNREPGLVVQDYDNNEVFQQLKVHQGQHLPTKPGRQHPATQVLTFQCSLMRQGFLKQRLYPHRWSSWFLESCANLYPTCSPPEKGPPQNRTFPLKGTTPWVRNPCKGTSPVHRNPL